MGSVSLSQLHIGMTWEAFKKYSWVLSSLNSKILTCWFGVGEQALLYINLPWWLRITNPQQWISCFSIHYQYLKSLKRVSIPWLHPHQLNQNLWGQAPGVNILSQHPHWFRCTSKVENLHYRGKSILGRGNSNSNLICNTKETG